MPSRTARGVSTRLEPILEKIVRLKEVAKGRRPVLVALSGIDASGKSTLARELEGLLALRGFRVALIGADAWHQPASRRFSDTDPAGHFYRNAFRFKELFRRLIDPLKREGSVTLTANLLRLSPESWYPHTYAFERVDVILLEGIFLLKEDLQERYDLSCWIDCSFPAALARALGRNQEALPREHLLADYRNIYFPAQKLHLATDWPRFFADEILRDEEEEPAPPPLRGTLRAVTERRARYGLEPPL